jgi:hypothetical protein
MLLVFSFIYCLLPTASAAGLLLGNGSHRNHLLILFAPGQTLRYELRHDGSVQTGAQLLTAVIQATGGLSITTAARQDNGDTIPLSSQLDQWNGQGLFAHFHQFSFGVFINGFASATYQAAADGSWSSYFTYQIAGSAGDFTTAPVGASERTLAEDDHDAYVFTGAFSSPGLAAWQAVHEITDLQGDPDSDGLGNLFEYALRKNPHLADSDRGVHLGHQEANGTTYLTLTYRRPHSEYATAPDGADAGYDGVGYTVETSTDLISWQSGTNHIHQTVSPDATGPMATVVARVPADLPRRFLRLRVHLP